MNFISHYYNHGRWFICRLIKEKGKTMQKILQIDLEKRKALEN